ncbi:MAG: ATP12 family protein [Sphingopyxis sp.]
MRRLYKNVSIAACDGGFAIHLDTKALRTPARCAFALESAALAKGIAAEWAEQGGIIAPNTMPLTGLSFAAIDLVMPDMAAFAAPLCVFGESDLLCYRADEPRLAAEQAQLWGPILSWAERHYGIDFAITNGIVHVPQSPTTLAALTNAVHGLNALQLAALNPLVTIGGSLVTGLALIERAFAANALWDVVALDEMWQERQWGAVDDAVEAREIKRAEWMAAARFLELI